MARVTAGFIEGRIQYALRGKLEARVTERFLPRARIIGSSLVMITCADFLSVVDDVGEGPTTTSFTGFIARLRNESRNRLVQLKWQQPAAARLAEFRQSSVS